MRTYCVSGTGLELVGTRLARKTTPLLKDLKAMCLSVGSGLCDKLGALYV